MGTGCTEVGFWSATCEGVAVRLIERVLVQMCGQRGRAVWRGSFPDAGRFCVAHVGGAGVARRGCVVLAAVSCQARVVHLAVIGICALRGLGLMAPALYTAPARLSCATIGWPASPCYRCQVCVVVQYVSGQRGLQTL
ncbi:unnamed protein product [Ostreobium quekettii]|uniref:Uncharacterized protein n=1 Tax=Ostreobium quekettii TaxID=121088 RepID=A0A8S1IKE4_9CHLO|nr:unnamed protein product [Ostreobium quekettii]